jgi:spermidine synthase
MKPIATIASPVSGEIVVYRDRTTGLITYTQGGYEQSAADRNGVSTASYIHALHGLALQTRARAVLVIGCGGGSLPRMLAASRIRVTVVDIDPASFDLARWYFSLPEDVECHVADGRDFLRTADARYDAIVLDAYDAANMPAHLAEREFFATVKRRLAPAGAFFVNAYMRDDDDPFAADLAKRLAAVWRSVRTLDTKGRVNRNAIVMAGNVANLSQPTMIMEPEIEADDVARDLRALQFRTR